MRVAIINIGQETNDFNPEPTTLRDYEAFGLFEGEALGPLTILAPAPPARNSARGVTPGTLRVLREELARAHHLCAAVRAAASLSIWVTSPLWAAECRRV